MPALVAASVATNGTSLRSIRCGHVAVVPAGGGGRHDERGEEHEQRQRDEHEREPLLAQERAVLDAEHDVQGRLERRVEAERAPHEAEEAEHARACRRRAGWRARCRAGPWPTGRGGCGRARGSGRSSARRARRSRAATLSGTGTAPARAARSRRPSRPGAARGRADTWRSPDARTRPPSAADAGRAGGCSLPWAVRISACARFNGMDAAAAIDELKGLSTQIEVILVAGRDGAVTAATVDGARAERLARWPAIWWPAPTPCAATSAATRSHSCRRPPPTGASSSSWTAIAWPSRRPAPTPPWASSSTT